MVYVIKLYIGIQIRYRMNLDVAPTIPCFRIIFFYKKQCVDNVSTLKKYFIIWIIVLTNVLFKKQKISFYGYLD